MPEHELVRVVRAGTTHAGDLQRAQADADAVEGLLAQAAAISAPTPESRLYLVALAREIEVLVAPWRSTFPVKALVDWHESVKRVIYARALLLFGLDEGPRVVQAPVEPLGPGGSVLPSMAARSGPSMFGLR